MSWSPRPLAELSNAVYLAAVAWTHQPLIAITLWVWWIGAILLIGWVAARGGEPQPLRLAALLFLFTFLFAEPDEMFFWPFAVFAYLGAWTGLALVTMQHRAGRCGSRGWLFGGLVAVLSVEIGAVTLLLDLGLAALLASGRVLGGSRVRVSWRAALLFGLASWVCVAVYLDRMRGMAEVFAPGSGLAGHWLADLRASPGPLLREIVGMPGVATAWAPIVKLLLLLGLPPASPRDSASRRRALVWALALLLGVWVSDMLAMHQFGADCCSRQHSLHQGMIVLAFAAAVPATRLLRVRRTMLLLGLIGLVVLREPALRNDLEAMPAAARARALTWASAHRPADPMLFVLPPTGRLFGGLGFWQPGSVAHWSPPAPPAYGADTVAAYFHHRTVRFVDQ